jgi:predicted hotdog family 3-hydroxylacyl-ACP dehydratase
VSRGTLGWAGPPAGPRPDDDPAAEPALGAPPALPHAGPSLLLAAAATLAPGEAAGRGRVPAGHAAIVAGRAAAFTAIELAAQLTTALAAGPARPLPAGAPRGYLVRLRAVRLAVPSFPVSTPLLARVVLEARNGPLATFRFDVRARAGGRIVDGALATYSLGP